MLILIADDEPIIRLGLKALLEEAGHQVVIAANGREALQQARRHDVDLAILDIKMPYTDGLEAAAALSRHAPLPIVLLTAFSDQELIEQASELPIHGYLVKPVQPGELAAAMAVATRRFAEAQRLRARAGELEEKLSGRKVVERAKARLMATGLSEEAAYQTIQRRARESRQSMDQVARSILQEP
ncbi:MAG: response regulator [Chloroflexi bacterium]|nr:response regulator [Chloroflexota bacterium]MCI0575196.1 response regulator [Chloroflexota bacterium]MCI0647122.1 response regulator [Chloroflexota bacterium]MCI0730002.1 response regulator [Chloroflexota bacterium]